MDDNTKSFLKENTDRSKKSEAGFGAFPEIQQKLEEM